ncbi:DsbA family oxidoreductase [Halobacterium wangiae]|uniref:DsbA family oxidoreductase n=1 Tax=Halobacterium wangiae TaxID=2902623 RepID=UPI001E33A470|nr:DsbA family protein [Halobacterium wangiae]
MSETNEITVYSDYVCPFCYLGRQSLAEYQENREDRLEIDWRPFDLRAGKRGPDGEIDHDADDGKDEAYFEQAKQNVQRLKEQYGADEMSLDLSRDVDSLDAQVASFYVKQEHPDQWLDFDVALLEALWEDARDIGDVDVLADVAEDVGLDPERIRSVVADEEWRERLEAQFAEAREAGVTGVPTFAYDGYAARGAVPPAQLRRLVEGTE